MPQIHALVDEGLGNSSYLVDLGDGRALAVDPSRDPDPYLAEARRHGLRLAFAAVPDSPSSGRSASPPTCRRARWR